MTTRAQTSPPRFITNCSQLCGGDYEYLVNYCVSCNGSFQKDIIRNTYNCVPQGQAPVPENCAGEIIERGTAGGGGTRGRREGGGVIKSEAQLESPLGPDIKNISDLAAKITKFVLLYLASPLVIVMIIYSGFLFMTSGGNPEKLKVARQALIYAIGGAIIIALAFGVGEVIKTFYSSK